MMLANRNNHDLMTHFFDDFFGTELAPRFNNSTPAVNIKEDRNSYFMEIAAPGIKKEFCQVSIDKDGNLNVMVENKCEHKDEDKREHYLRREFSYSNYEQVFALPENVDKKAIQAKVNDGILTITMPKVAPSETEKSRQKIEIH